MARLLVILSVMISVNAHALKFKDGEATLDKLDDYSLCQTKDPTGQDCHEALKRWVDLHPNDAFKAGKLTRRAMNSSVAIPFFAQAFNAKMGDCKDQDVLLAVISALDLPADNYAELVTQAKAIGLKTCFKEMKEKINEGASIDSNRFKNSCRELAAGDALPAMKKDICKQMK
jgi:hypothetical protein